MPKKPLIERPAPTITSQPPAPSPAAPEMQLEPVLTESPLPEEIVEQNLGEELFSLPYIDNRLSDYGRKLERWKELDSRGMAGTEKELDPADLVSCFRKMQDVIRGYNELRGRVMQVSPATDRAAALSIVEIQKSDIDFMESQCGRMLAEPGEKVPEVAQREETADLVQLESMIEQHSAKKEYQKVVMVWQGIPPTQLGRVNLRSRIHYGNALIYLRQQGKAAEIYQQVVDQMSASEEQPIDLVSLRKVLADLYMATGNARAAAVQYQQISEDYRKIGRQEEWANLQLSILERAAEAGPEMREYSALLRNYLSYVPEEDGYKVLWQADKFLEQYPYSPVSSNVDVIKENVTAAADRWFDGFMAGIDRLSSEGKFKEALEQLENIPADILGADKQLIVKNKNDELLLGEEVEKETDRMSEVQDLQNQWNKGMLLADEEKFDEAIAVFAGLLDTEYAGKAREKIKEVSLKGAHAERKKAGDLFVRYKKTTDLEGRKKLLLESRRVLKDILVKYPDVEIAPKVISNIERVEQEMVAIDPAMLVLADQEDTPMAGPDGVDQVFSPQVVNPDGQQKETNPPYNQ